MKIARILSAAAATVVATAALAATASANFIPDSGTTDYINAAGTGNYMIQVFNDSPDADYPMVDLAGDAGFSLGEIASVTFTVYVPEDEQPWFDGAIGGGVGFSLHSPDDMSTYNWVSAAQFWGVEDEDLGIVTIDTAQSGQLVKVGDYTYSITAPIDGNATQEIAGGAHGYRIFLQGWDNGMASYSVIESTISDASNNVLVKLDGKGNVLQSKGAASTPAPAEDTTPSTTPAPTTPSADKGSPDTGVEGVAAVAGAAVIAAGALALSKKRK